MGGIDVRVLTRAILPEYHRVEDREEASVTAAIRVHMMTRSTIPRKWPLQRIGEVFRIVLVCGLAAAMTSCHRPAGETSSPDSGPAPLVIAGIPSDEFPAGSRLSTEFTQRTGIPVRLIPSAEFPAERFAQYRKMLQRKSRVPDVYALDVTWPAALAAGLADLRPVFGGDLSPFLPRFVENNVVRHRLVAIPLIADVGLLYYRTDLLRKYGYHHPPRTWKELESMARVIQAGERRAGRTNFWGYIWQGAADESLTCNALEWQAAFGGGNILEANHTVSVNNPQTVEALRMAKRWIGSISPPSVVAYEEDDARNLWEAGDAAFMRNWPYAYVMSEAADSAVRGHFDVTMLPAGSVRRAAVLGGWSLAISKYSAHPAEAARFIRFVTSTRMEVERADIATQLPTRASIYHDPAVLQKIPVLARARQALLSTAIARPSVAAAGRYSEVSTAYFTAVHSVLAGDIDAATAMARLQKQLMQITGYPAGPPLPEPNISP